MSKTHTLAIDKRKYFVKINRVCAAGGLFRQIFVLRAQRKKLARLLVHIMKAANFSFEVQRQKSPAPRSLARLAGQEFLR